MEFKDLVPIIIAVIAAGPGLFALFGQKRKDKRDEDTSNIENAGKVTAQALTLVAPLTLRITELEAKVTKLEEENEVRDKKINQQDKIINEQNIRLTSSERQIQRLKMGIKKLIDQIIRLGHVPDWYPETEGE